MMSKETLCVCLWQLFTLPLSPCAHPVLPHQTASGHTDVWGSRLTQGPVLDLFGVTDIEAEATGTAVQFTALGTLN